MVKWFIFRSRMGSPFFNSDRLPPTLELPEFEPAFGLTLRADDVAHMNALNLENASVGFAAPGR